MIKKLLAVLLVNIIDKLQYDTLYYYWQIVKQIQAYTRTQTHLVYIMYDIHIGYIFCT